MELKAVRDREVAPLDLAKSIGAAVHEQAVLLDLLGIEIGDAPLLPASSIQLRDELAEGSPRLVDSTSDFPTPWD